MAMPSTPTTAGTTTLPDPSLRWTPWAMCHPSPAGTTAARCGAIGVGPPRQVGCWQLLCLLLQLVASSDVRRAAMAPALRYGSGRHLADHFCGLGPSGVPQRSAPEAASTGCSDAGHPCTITCSTHASGHLSLCSAPHDCAHHYGAAPSAVHRPSSLAKPAGMPCMLHVPCHACFLATRVLNPCPLSLPHPQR